MEEADWLVDFGPGAGEHGGEIVAAGHARGGEGEPDLPHRRVPLRAARDRGARARRRTATGTIRIAGARREQPQERRRRSSRSARSSRSPASPARASRRWSTTSCYPALSALLYGTREVPGHARGHPRASSTSTRSSTSTSSPSAARRARTRRPTPRSSTRSATSSRRRPRRAPSATSPAASAST